MSFGWVKIFFFKKNDCAHMIELRPRTKINWWVEKSWLFLLPLKNVQRLSMFSCGRTVRIVAKCWTQITKDAAQSHDPILENLKQFSLNTVFYLHEFFSFSFSALIFFFCISLHSLQWCFGFHSTVRMCSQRNQWVIKYKVPLSHRVQSSVRESITWELVTVASSQPNNLRFKKLLLKP